MTLKEIILAPLTDLDARYAELLDMLYHKDMLCSERRSHDNVIKLVEKEIERRMIHELNKD